MPKLISQQGEGGKCTTVYLLSIVLQIYFSRGYLSFLVEKSIIYFDADDQSDKKAMLRNKTRGFDCLLIFPFFLLKRKLMLILVFSSVCQRKLVENILFLRTR